MRLCTFFEELSASKKEIATLGFILLELIHFSYKSKAPGFLPELSLIIKN
jgi:hypothetical protein